MSGWKQRPIAPVEPAQLIPVAAPKPQRNREYEKKHPVFVIRVRDESIREKILGLAQELSVPADDVARAFLEAGLDAAEKGSLDLSGICITRGRMTLYPTGEETWKVHDEPVSWSREAPTARRRKPRTDGEKTASQKALNQKRLAYRLPHQTVARFKCCYLDVMGIQAEKELARHEGRKGELFLLLLEYALKQYQTGRLPLIPQAVTVISRLK